MTNEGKTLPSHGCRLLSHAAGWVVWGQSGKSPLSQAVVLFPFKLIIHSKRLRVLCPFLDLIPAAGWLPTGPQHPQGSAQPSWGSVQALVTIPISHLIPFWVLMDWPWLGKSPSCGAAGHCGTQAVTEVGFSALVVVLFIVWTLSMAGNELRTLKIYGVCFLLDIIVFRVNAPKCYVLYGPHKARLC